MRQDETPSRATEDPAASDTDRRFLTIDEAAEILRVSRRTIARLLERDVLKSVRPSPGRTLIPRDDFERYVRACSGDHAERK